MLLCYLPTPGDQKGIKSNNQLFCSCFSSLSAFLGLSSFTLLGESLASQSDGLLVLSELSLLLKLVSDWSLNEVVGRLAILTVAGKQSKAMWSDRNIM